MIIGWEQELEALWKQGGEEGRSKFVVTIELEGPKRDSMTGCDPIWEKVEALGGRRLHEVAGRSTAEGLALHVEQLVNRHLEPSPDMRREVRVVQDEVFWTEI